MSSSRPELVRPAGHRAAGRASLAPPAGTWPGVARASGEIPRAPVMAGHPQLLVVEDDQELSGVLARYLSEEGFVVERAEDGEWALRRLTSVDCPIDAVVLDLMLPGLSGREVCRRLREAGRWVPVLMVTALGEIEDRVQGFTDGADDYLAKPFSLHELVMRLRAVLRRSGGCREAVGGGRSVIEVGDLRLDLLSRRCWRADVELTLARREFEVLEFFMRRPGLVISRPSILAAIWGKDAPVSANTVDQYLAHLRRKIDLPFGRADLETLPRVGYRLRAPWPG